MQQDGLVACGLQCIAGCIIGVIPLTGCCYQVAAGPQSGLHYCARNVLWSCLAFGIALGAKKCPTVWGLRWCNSKSAAMGPSRHRTSFYMNIRKPTPSDTIKPTYTGGRDLTILALYNSSFVFPPQNAFTVRFCGSRVHARRHHVLCSGRQEWSTAA